MPSTMRFSSCSPNRNISSIHQPTRPDHVGLTVVLTNEHRSQDFVEVLKTVELEKPLGLLV